MHHAGACSGGALRWALRRGHCDGPGPPLDVIVSGLVFQKETAAGAPQARWVPNRVVASQSRFPVRRLQDIHGFGLRASSETVGSEAAGPPGACPRLSPRDLWWPRRRCPADAASSLQTACSRPLATRSRPTRQHHRLLAARGGLGRTPAFIARMNTGPGRPAERRCSLVLLRDRHSDEQWPGPGPRLTRQLLLPAAPPPTHQNGPLHRIRVDLPGPGLAGLRARFLSFSLSLSQINT